MSKQAKMEARAKTLYLGQLTGLVYVSTPWEHLTEQEKYPYLVQAAFAIRQEEGREEEIRDQIRAEAKAFAMTDLNTMGILSQHEVGYLIDVLDKLKTAVPNLLISEHKVATVITVLMFGEVSVEDAVSILVKYHMNVEDKHDFLRVKLGGKGPSHG